MPTKVRGRSTVSRSPEVCLPMAAGQKEGPLGVSKTALLSPDVLMAGLMHLLGVPCLRTPDRSS
jgi:hypothetical protein